MKFNVTRKIYLANIDKKIWPFETEELGINDADSFDEAHKIVDQAVSERIGYYKARAEMINNKGEIKKEPEKPVAQKPPAPNIVNDEAPKNMADGVTSSPPAAFNI